MLPAHRSPGRCPGPRRHRRHRLAGELLEWAPDPRVYSTGAGRRVVHLHQHYRGIPVFEAMRTVIFAAEASAGDARQRRRHRPLRLEPFRFPRS